MMVEPTTDNYVSVLQKLLPRGAAWPKTPGATLTKLLRGLVGVFVAVHIRLIELLIELDPRDTTEMLTDWEALAGLPDSCCAADVTDEERRQAVIAKLTTLRRPTIQYYMDLAVALGEPDVTITEFTPLTCESHCESPVVDTTWRFVWQVNIPNRVDVRSYFRAGSRCGGRVDEYDKGRLECQLKRLKPAYTYVKFNYL